MQSSCLKIVLMFCLWTFQKHLLAAVGLKFWTRFVIGLRLSEFQSPKYRVLCLDVLVTWSLMAYPDCRPRKCISEASNCVPRFSFRHSIFMPNTEPTIALDHLICPSAFVLKPSYNFPFSVHLGLRTGNPSSSIAFLLSSLHIFQLITPLFSNSLCSST